MPLRLVHNTDRHNPTPSDVIQGLYAEELKPPKQAPVEFVRSDFEQGMLTRLTDQEENEVDYFLFKAVWWAMLLGWLVAGAHVLWWWFI